MCRFSDAYGLILGAGLVRIASYLYKMSGYPLTSTAYITIAPCHTGFTEYTRWHYFFSGTILFYTQAELGIHVMYIVTVSIVTVVMQIHSESVMFTSSHALLEAGDEAWCSYIAMSKCISETLTLLVGPSAR